MSLGDGEIPVNVSRNVTRANQSQFFSLLVKVVTMVMSLGAGVLAPQILHTLDEIKQHSVRISVLEERGSLNASNIAEIKTDIKEIQRLILSRTEQRISPEDIRRRFEADEDRIKMLEKENMK